MSIAFNTLDYTKGAEAIGIKREHAEYQAEQLFKIIDNDLVTKSFLSTELKSLEIRLIKWIVGMSIAQAGLLLSIMGFVFKH